MVLYKSFDVQQDSPIASHGLGRSVYCARFQVTLPITANADTIDFGRLPDYAVPVNARAISTGTFVGNIGITGAAAGFFSAVTLAANVPQATALSTLLGKNVGLGGAAVTGLVTGAGTAGTLNLFIDYVLEDVGSAYAYVAAV
jgi:hypothetical protein